MSFVEAEMAEVGAGRTLAGFAVHGQLTEVVRQVRHAAERGRADGLGVGALKGVLQHHQYSHVYTQSALASFISLFDAVVLIVVAVCY